MALLDGLGVTITDKKALTCGKPGVIEKFDKEVKKWKISFDENWCGWYTRPQFRIDRSKSK
jgi:hypothetical protein